MVSSVVFATSKPCSIKPWPSNFTQNNSRPLIVGFRNKEVSADYVKTSGLISYSLPSIPDILWNRKSLLLPFAASAMVILSCGAAHAGFMSGFSGIESVPGPELPRVDFLNRWNEENQKKYAEADARFKESPLLKKLLEQSKLNKEKNRQATSDKYCVRGAEWGVGDCSADGMSPEDREKFISMLKKKAGIE